MQKQELAKKIFQKCYLQGEFTLRSGKTSKEYFDKYALESDPEILQAVAEQLSILIPKDTEVLAALEMGAIPIGTALSLKTGLPIRFVRKKAKDYGTQKVCEGGDIVSKKLCVIEDVITTGGQVIKSVQDLRKEGAIIDTVVCVIHRGQDAKNLEQTGLNLISLFKKEDLVNS